MLHSPPALSLSPLATIWQVSLQPFAAFHSPLHSLQRSATLYIVLQPPVPFKPSTILSVSCDRVSATVYNPLPLSSAATSTAIYNRQPSTTLPPSDNAPAHLLHDAPQEYSLVLYDDYFLVANTMHWQVVNTIPHALEGKMQQPLGGGGGRARSLYATPPQPPPPPPRVLRGSGVGAMAPTAPKFFCACFPFIKPSMF